MHIVKPGANHAKFPRSTRETGFVLVVTLTLLVLLSVIALGMLGMSAISLRSGANESATMEARANARMALMIAIGELQKEMGPDMRISAESAVLDSDHRTEAMEGVSQSRWMGVYDSWGNWLNDSYTRPSGGSLSITDTYDKGRSPMFRRWLLSLPTGEERNIDSPLDGAGMDDSNSVVMAGPGSLSPDAPADSITRAYLLDVGGSGKYAWWISPENHKARIDMAKINRSIEVADWESSQGNTEEVGVGVLNGLSRFDAAPELAPRMISKDTLAAAGAEAADVKRYFFDLSAHGKGVVASVRTGHLKRDLSLLFENPVSNMPSMYRFQAGSRQEPSIRPMSPDLLAKNPKVTARHFQSWTNMRYFHRMYRRDPGPSRGIGNADSLQWDGTKPYTSPQYPFCPQGGLPGWEGENSYNRMPVLAKLTYIYSLMTRRVNPASTTDLRRFLYLVYTPVFTYWNPYNTELRIPDDTLGCLSSTYQVFPMRTQFYLQNTAQTVSHQGLSTNNLSSYLRSGNGGDIVFKPGEFRIFSHSSLYPGGTSGKQNLVPGFDPSAYGGDLLQISIRNPSENPGFAIYFGHSEWGGNINFGNTPGSLNFVSYWGPQAGATKWIPLMYQNDWFNLSQQYTPLTPDPQPGANRVATRPGNILRWNFSDESPVPVGFSQHVLKGASSFNHESIPAWRKDWRCRNWLQAPPFYFGNNMYISENNDIAQTQRTDNAFVVNFGGMSASEMPKVVPHIGNNGFLGSGAAPVEKVTSAAALELPTAPMGSLAGYAAMRTNPGWARASAMNPNLFLSQTGAGNLNIASLGFALVKQNAYQSGVTGPGIGNSFLHPMIPRGDVYRYFNNSISQDPHDRNQPLGTITANDNMVFCDYWDHTFLLNDALWDDYFVSSLADQTRPSASTATSLDESIRRFVSGGQIPNSRYMYWPNGRTSTEVESELKSTDGFLKCAGHLLVDGSFNVNSTSVAAWRALFAGIRERQAVYRDGSGMLRNIPIPSGKRIALTRFNTEVANSEMATPENGTTMPDGMPGWSGVRFLSDDEIRKLAEECVAQVKRRGPFLNFSEFINRRLSNDELGIMGALQSAIDYDDFLSGPEAQSLNFRFKNGNAHLLKPADVDINGYATPEAAVGSRFAGIPGYLVQSDILKPIANTLTVRDDTFRIRAYGESRDATGRVTARAWCEAILQRTPEYCDPANPAETPMRSIGPDGSIKDANQLNATNLKFGRRFRMESFRWLGKDEV